VPAQTERWHDEGSAMSKKDKKKSDPKPTKAIPAAPPETNVPRVETRQLRDLLEFPEQKNQFPTMSEDRLRALAANIKRNKLRQKIEVLPENKAGYPPNTIISGHMRRRALLLNGETATEAIIRYDLAEASASVIEREFLEANDHKRNHDPLVEIGLALRLIEVDKGRARGQLSQREEEQARAALCKRMRMTDRNVRRYIRVLRAPAEIQDAFREKKLSLVEAGKVADLSEKVQREIAVRIQAGEPPRQVLREYVGGKDGRRHVKDIDALNAFHRAMCRHLDDLDGRIESISPQQVDKYRAGFQRARDVLDQLLNKHDAGTPHHRHRHDEEE
jgi:hypothetical protein